MNPKAAMLLILATALAGCSQEPTATDSFLTATPVQPIDYDHDTAGEFHLRPCQATLETCNGAAIGGAGTGLAFTVDPLQASNYNEEALFWRLYATITWTSNHPNVDILHINITTIPRADDPCAPRTLLEDNKTTSPIQLHRLDLYILDCEAGIQFTVMPNNWDTLIAPMSIKYDAKITVQGFIRNGEDIAL